MKLQLFSLSNCSIISEVMANTKKFDQEKVLVSSMSLFWEKGYWATSTRDLQKATSLKPGSLYSTFKSKEQLFAETLKCYKKLMQAQYEACKADEVNPLVALKCFVLTELLTEPSPPSYACFVYKTHTELKNTELACIAEQSLQEFYDWFLDLFAEAIAQKFLSKDKDPKLLVKQFYIQFHGWRAYLSMTEDKVFVRKEIESYFDELTM